MDSEIVFGFKSGLNVIDTGYSDPKEEQRRRTAWVDRQRSPISRTASVNKLNIQTVQFVDSRHMSI